MKGCLGKGSKFYKMKNYEIVMKRCVLLFFGIFIFGVMLVSFGSASDMKISPEGVKYHKDIESKFLYQSKVYVSVLLKDNSGVVYSGTKDERHKQWIIRKQWFESKMVDFLYGLDKKYFVLDTRTSFSFSGLMTKEGFEYLKNNSDIEAIDFVGSGSAQSTSDVFKLRWYVWLLIGLIISLSILLIIKLKNHGRKHVSKHKKK